MADPKYAALPGIAFDQPDFYESEDVPVTDQDFISQDQSDCIEKLSTNLKESFSKFDGYWLDTRRADFSGKIGVKRHTGYSSWNGPYELQAAGEKETPLQKLNRLKCEFAELQEEVAQCKDEKSGEPPADVLTSQLEFLQKQLMDIKLQETVNSLSGPKSFGNQEAAKKKLFSQLEQVLQAEAGKSNKQLPGAEASNIVYQLQYTPHQMKMENAAKVANLVNRLDRLEQLFGTNSEKLVSLNAETGQKSLADAIKVISSKVSLLDTSHVDQVEARLGVLIQKLNTINDKHSAIEEADKLAKVKDIYDMMKKLEPVMTVIPSVVDRLLSLKKLHEEALNFSHSLTELENAQQRTDTVLRTQSQLLGDIQSGLANNMETMKTAIKDLEGQLSSRKK